jgi:hypothetical protein
MGRQLLNEPTQVEALFDRDGGVAVRAFKWKNKRWPVVSQGRQWADARDGRRHVLVMTTRERVYELAYDPASAGWSVVMASEDRLMA